MVSRGLSIEILGVVLAYCVKCNEIFTKNAKMPPNSPTDLISLFQKGSKEILALKH